ncbi:MAG: hypothetical protein GX800_00325 [Clostridiaceae bacterium]|nr:hypothetical protein [Clostridiaceae bacterium]
MVIIMDTMNAIMQYVNDNLIIFYATMLWSMVWKGLALWRAAKLNKVGFFVALLIINTVGIFEIIFLIATRKKAKE